MGTPKPNAAILTGGGDQGAVGMEDHLIDFVAGINLDRRSGCGAIWAKRHQEQHPVGGAGGEPLAVAGKRYRVDLQGGPISRRSHLSAIDKQGNLPVRPSQEPSSGNRTSERRIGSGALPQVVDGPGSVADPEGLEGPAQISGRIIGRLCGPAGGIFLRHRFLAGNALGSFLDDQPAEGNGHDRHRNPGGKRRIAADPADGAIDRSERSGDRRPAIEKPCQVNGEFGGRWIAVGGSLGQALEADGDDVWVNPRHHAVGRLRLNLENAAVDGLPRLARVDAPPGQQPVENEAERMDVGPGIDGADHRIDLFGGHPLGRPEDLADLGRGGTRGIMINVDNRGAQAEIAELHPLALGDR